MTREQKERLKRGALTALGLFAFLGLALGAWVWFAPCWLGGCAPVDDLAEYQAEGSVLLDVNEEQFGTLATVNRRLISIDSLPPHVLHAFLAVEDQRFYDHGGVDFRRLFGAVLSNIRAGGVAEGGSTITQQLARNLFPEWLPYQERSLRRKIMEARVARQIERSFSKDKILELYLNHIYLGEGAYGIDAAARTYFGKPASELTLAEAAMLGGLPQAPSQLNPVANRERSTERRDLVLGQMAEAGYISEAEAEEARGQEIALRSSGADSAAPSGAYFIERVRQEMEEVVGSRFYTAGLRIYTTLDGGAQRASEEELARQLDAIEAGGFGVYRHGTYPENKAGAGGAQTTYVQGAVLLMEAGTGEVRALVGGRDFEDSKFDRAILAQRQPGSAFKPFVYLAALERFGDPTHIVDDSPVRVAMAGGRTWEPRNYTGSYDGPITMREAITRSKNAATVHLAQEIGLQPVVSTARQLGLAGDIDQVPSTALGVAEVRPIELVRAYGAFANGGTLVEPHFIRRVEDRHGRVVWQASPRSDRILDPAAAFVLTSMLRDVVDRGTGTAARIGGYRGPAAGKTGTTNDAADVWFIGYTPELVGGVWIGMDERKTIVRGASGGTLAAPVWGRIMGRVYQSRPTPAAWSPPSGVNTAEVDRVTGSIVGDGCPPQGPTYTEYFLGRVPMATCYDARYERLAVYDSLWTDEEWGAGLSDSTDLEGAGIDWPELEELRRRLRLGQSRTGTDTLGEQRDPRLDQPPIGLEGESAREAMERERTEERRREQGEEQAEEQGEQQGEEQSRPPPVLGVPVDSAGGGSGQGNIRPPASY
jgi:penicillin-binding protein 1A